MGIDGSARMYTLSGLEEYTEFTITLSAVNGAGSTSVSRVVRTMAGNYILRAWLYDQLGEVSLKVMNTFLNYPLVKRYGLIIWNIFVVEK